MAVPPDLRAATASGSSDHPAGLIDHAVRLLVEHLRTSRVAGAAWRFGPLVLVSNRPSAAAEAVGVWLDAPCGSHPGCPHLRRDGEDLDRDIAASLAGERLEKLADTLAACRLVIVDRLERVRGTAHRRALATLIDASTAAGTTWCVSVPRLHEDELGGLVASRLAGGLVVTAAPEPAPAVAHGPMPTLGRILRAAARHHDVPVAALTGPQRRRTVAGARSLAMYLARRLTGRSLQAIGAACGGRDHTTVLHGVRVCDARMRADPGYAADVERLAAELTTSATPASLRRRRGVCSAPLARTGANGRRTRRHRA